MTEASLPGNPGPPVKEPGFVRTRERRRFGTALLLSGLAHAVVILLLLALWQSSPVEPPPLTAIPIKLVHGHEGRAGAIGGGKGGTTASAPTAGTASAASSTATEPQPPEPETKGPSQPQQPIEPQQQEQAETPSQPTHEDPPSEPAIRPLAAAQSLTPQATLPEPAPPKPAIPRRKREPYRPRPPHRARAFAEARPVPLPVPVQPQAVPAPDAAPRSAVALSAPLAAPGPLADGSGGPGRGEAGTGQSATGDRGSGRGNDDYPDIVRRWITRFQQYPPEARDKKEEGTAVVGFRFTRDGTILNAWLEKSSGYPLLDDEAVKMVRNASPIPKVPPQDSCAGTCTMGAMPVRFSIGFFDRLFR